MSIGMNVAVLAASHLDVHPPEEVSSPRSWMWHQDGGVVNRDLETSPRPRLSVVAYDRRMWHVRSLNTSNLTRKALIHAYTYGFEPETTWRSRPICCT